MEKRTWDPRTSKWKAALEKGMNVKLKGNENILYLGASSGTTVGHLSSKTKGDIYAVEKSYQMAIPLINLSEKKDNIIPLFCDAQDIDYISKKVDLKSIDILFCDIPNFNQVNILIKISKLVNKDCKILFSLKTQSISQGDPENTLKEAKKELSHVFNIIDFKSIEPYHKKHWFFILSKK